MPEASVDQGAMGQRIREARTYLEMSQEEVAAALGISRPAMTNIEQGTRGVGALELVKLARVLNRSVEYLTGEQAEPPAEDEKVRILARAAQGLSDADLAELQRFAAFLKSRSDTPE